jgi:hypothetical protein
MVMPLLLVLGVEALGGCGGSKGSKAGDGAVAAPTDAGLATPADAAPTSFASDAGSSTRTEVSPATDALVPLAPPPPSGDTSGTIVFHIPFPTPKGDSYQLAPSQVDLLMSEVISGAMLGHLIAEHRRLQNQKPLPLNRDYLYGTLIGQLLQENLQPDYKDSTQEWIDTDASQRQMLLNSGQGGPYQLNDYSRRLDSNLGLINFIMLQKGLGFSVADQDNNTQTGRTGPDSLENKYFGPMAAAYFHYNDFLRVETLSASAWYSAAASTKACFAKVEAGLFDGFDMLLNAIYNAGSFSSSYEGYAALCAHADDASWAGKLAKINDYSLGDAAYSAATGIVSSGTFVLYPRQIRNYLDQLYNIDTHILPVGQVVLKFDMPNLRYVFQRVFASLGIKDPKSGAWRSITADEAGTAFDGALAQTGLSAGGALTLSATADRGQIFNLLEAALTALHASLGVDFTATSESNLATGETGPSQGPRSCPTNPPVYPSGRGSYAAGTVVQASDQLLYRCQIAGWCNSTADSYYAPATGSAWADAWVVVQCPAP